MPTIPASQDLPPKGGFPTISYLRYLPKRGPSSGMLITGLVLFTAWGCYKYIRATKLIIELEREKLQSRISLVPLLMAEQDFDRCTKILETERIEKAVGMEPSWQLQVYHKNTLAERSIVTNEKGEINMLPYNYDLYISDGKPPITIQI